MAALNFVTYLICGCADEAGVVDEQLDDGSAITLLQVRIDDSVFYKKRLGRIQCVALVYGCEKH